MKIKIYFVPYLFLLLFCFQSQCGKAQCTARYLDTIFTSVDSATNIVYTDSAGGVAGDTELLDIYQPAGDTACLRHLAIWVHGGAFFEGTKNDGDVTYFSQKFAQRGYVCASINYRLAGSVLDLYDSAQIFTYIMKAFSDMKAAIRYFYKDASLTNQWNIDTNSIFIGGSSAGGIAADYVGLVDSVSEFAAPFQPICNSNGGITGNSGNQGYSTKAIAIASLAGAVDVLSYIKPTSPPMVFCQGTADGTIPYYCGNALTQYIGNLPTIRFCGSGEMSPQLDSVGVSNSLLPFPGSGHVPWDTNTLILERTDSATAAFYYSVKCTQAKCTGPLAIANVAPAGQLTIYPNPANTALNVELPAFSQTGTLKIYNINGQLVYQQAANAQKISIPTSNLSEEVYAIRLENGDSYTGAKRFVVSH